MGGLNGSGTNQENIHQKPKTENKVIQNNKNTDIENQNQNQKPVKIDVSNEPKFMILNHPMDTSGMKPAANIWENRYTKKDIEKYRLNQYNEKIFQVGDNEEEWNRHAAEPVNLDISAAELEQMNEEALSVEWNDMMKRRFDIEGNGVPPVALLTDMRTKLLNLVKPEDGSSQENYGLNLYNDTLLDGEETGNSFKYLKDHDLWNDYKLITKTQRYYSYRDLKRDVHFEQAESVRRQKFTHKAVVAPDLAGGKYQYEDQGGTFNCYACAGAKIFNQFTGAKNNEGLNQWDLRNFQPRFLCNKEIEKNRPGTEGADMDRRNVLKFAGEGKTAFGNLVSISDIFFDHKNGGKGRRDMILRNTQFRLDESNNELAMNNIREVMKEKISKGIDAGRVVSIFTHGHYVTITGIDGDNIQYLDSYNNPTFEEPKIENLDTFLRGHDEQGNYDVAVELNWAEKVDENSMARLKNEYGDMVVDEATGEIRRKGNDVLSDESAHRAGILLLKTDAEKERDGYADVARVMTETVCLHRGTFMNENQFEDWKKRDEAAWAIAQGEIKKEDDAFLLKQQLEEERLLRERLDYNPRMYYGTNDLSNTYHMASKRRTGYKDGRNDEDVEKPKVKPLLHPVSFPEKEYELKELNAAYKTRDAKLTSRLRVHDTVAKNYMEPLVLLVMKISQINGDDDGSAADLYKILKKLYIPGQVSFVKGSNQKLTQAASKCVRVMEKVFHTVLSFDVGILDGLDKKDFCTNPELFAKCADLFTIMPEFEKLTVFYATAKANTVGNCALNIEDLKLIHARMELLKAAQQKLLPQLDASKNKWEKKKDEKEDVEGIQEEDKNKDAFSRLLAEQRTPEKNKAITSCIKKIETKSEKSEQRYRKKFLDNMKTEIKKDFRPSAYRIPTVEEEKRRFGKKKGKKAKVLTNTEREDEIRKNGTELNSKFKLHKELRLKVLEARDKLARHKRELSFNEKLGLSDEELNAVSAFFDNDVKINSSILRGYSGRSLKSYAVKLSGEDRLEAKFHVMDIITTKFLSIDIGKFDLRTDEKLVQHSYALENLTMMVEGYRTLFEDKANEEYFDRLENKPVDGGGEANLLECVKRQFDLLGPLTDYYRARKLVLTNSYYLTHHNDEIMNPDDNSDDIEPEHFDLIKKLRLSNRTIWNVQGMRTNYDKKKHMWKNKPGTWLASDTRGEIAVHEKEHNSRAHVLGTFDVTKCTRDAQLNLMQEMIRFRKELAKSKKSRTYLRLIKDNDPIAERLLKKYSPMFQNLVKTIVRGGSDLHAIANSLRPELLGQLRDLITPSKTVSKTQRLTTNNDQLEFKDKKTNTTFKIRQSMQRFLSQMVLLASGQGMADEEVLEMMEGLTVASRGDVDMTDPQQQEEARTLYLRSMAKLVTMVGEQQKRYIKELGMLPAQLSPLAFAVAAGDNLKTILARTSMAVTFHDILLAKESKNSDGESVNIMELLVEEGFLSREYAEEARRNADYFNCCQRIMNGTVSGDACGFSQFLFNMNDGSFIDMNPKAFYDELNAYRGKIDGPTLKEDEENKGWVTFSEITTVTGAGKMCESQQESSITVLRENAHYTQSMRQLELFRRGLDSVETGGHSNNYREMERTLETLRQTLSNIARKTSPQKDNLNLDPIGIKALKEAYLAAIRATRTYLKDKNFNHSNLKYRRRYEIAKEMQSLMEKDEEALLALSPNKSYNLTEVLDGARATTVDYRKTTALSGSINKRYMFKTEINGEQKDVVYTRYKNNEIGDLSSRLSELDKDVVLNNNQTPQDGIKIKGFSKFSTIIKACGGTDYLIKNLFQNKYYINYFNEGIRSNMHPVLELEKVETPFLAFLDKVWAQYGKGLSKIDKSLRSDKNENMLRQAYETELVDSKLSFFQRLLKVGETWRREYVTMVSYERYGIKRGANIDKRNVAMTIMAKELGAEKSIAHSGIAKVNIKGDVLADKTDDKHYGTWMEFIQGENIDSVKNLHRKGLVVMDNEADLIEQLSDMQVTDYICGNTDRHMDNIMFELENTGEEKEVTSYGKKEKKPVQRIKRIVGIDNDFSFGIMNAKDLTSSPKHMSIPENMQIISQRTANKILSLDKNAVFIRLGTTLTDEEKESMWTRVVHMQQTIKASMEKDGPGRMLNILKKEDFKEVSLRELAKANLSRFNLFNDVYRSLGGSRLKIAGNELQPNQESVPHRLDVKELRVDIIPRKTSMNRERDMATFELLREISSPSNGDLTGLMKKKSPAALNRLYEKLENASIDFENHIANLFNNVSTNDTYGDPKNPYVKADMFSNQYAREHGFNSLLDVVFIDGKPASEVLSGIPETVRYLMDHRHYNDAGGKQQDIIKKVALPENANGNAGEMMKEMVAKALIMSYFVSGAKQITIANYQKKRNVAQGRQDEDELVITDLNPVLGLKLEDAISTTLPKGTKVVGSQNDSSMIVKSRKNRKKRFMDIKDKIEQRRVNRNPQPPAGGQAPQAGGPVPQANGQVPPQAGGPVPQVNGQVPPQANGQ